MDKVSIEGSPERAADRGRDQLDFPVGPKPMLGNPDTVRGLVQAFASAVVAVRIDFNSGTAAGDECLKRLQALATEYGDIFMGRNDAYAALPWNSPEHLGARIEHTLFPISADPGAALFTELSRAIVDIAKEHEAGRMADKDAKQHAVDAIDSVTHLLMGTP